MLIVHATPPAWGLPSVSPFVVKLHAWLRIAGIPYEARVANPMNSPKGKIPFVEDDGVRIGDSQLIVEHLTRKHGVTLDEGMTPAEQATARLVRRTLEEATYFPLLYTRWHVDENYAVYAPYFRALMPPGVGHLVVPMIRRRMRAYLHAQGTGRHAVDDVYAMGKADFTALSGVLGDRPYLLGDAPRSVDATVYAFCACAMTFPRETAIAAHVRTLPNLVSYVERFKARWFPPSELAPTR